MPSLRNAMNMAKSAACLSHLHTAGLALAHYEASNDGFLFPPSVRVESMKKSFTVFEVLVWNDYLSDTRYGTCPGAEFDIPIYYKKDMNYYIGYLPSTDVWGYWDPWDNQNSPKKTAFGGNAYSETGWYSISMRRVFDPRAYIQTEHLQNATKEAYMIDVVLHPRYYDPWWTTGFTAAELKSDPITSPYSDGPGAEPYAYFETGNTQVNSSGERIWTFASIRHNYMTNALYVTGSASPLDLETGNVEWDTAAAWFDMK